MENIFAVQSKEELLKLQAFVQDIQPELNRYVVSLKNEYAVKDLPRCIVWTNEKTAMTFLSDIPVPAYTNEFRTVMVPDVEVWRSIYLKQLDVYEEKNQSPKEVSAIREYYKASISRNHVMQIVGHELAHHSELFLDDFNSDYSDGIWFEEGMVEYISRKFFLTKEEFNAASGINGQLVNLFKQKYGKHSLEEFGYATYEGNYASIFYEYWRSFLAVQRIVEERNGDVMQVFEEYHKWNLEGKGQTLVEWFNVCI